MYLFYSRRSLNENPEPPHMCQFEELCLLLLHHCLVSYWLFWKSSKSIGPFLEVKVVIFLLYDYIIGILDCLESNDTFIA